MLIVVAGLKGGTGKTTAAVLLAEASADRDGSALLVDADPQNSAMRWADDAADAGAPLRCVTVSLPTSDLRRRLPAITRGHAVTVIDTPPGALSIVTAALSVADAVLVPVQPTLADLDRARVTLDLVAELCRDALVVLTRTRRGTRSLEAARSALAGSGARIAAVDVPQREAIAAAFGTRPSGELLALGAALLNELTTTTTTRKRRKG